MKETVRNDIASELRSLRAKTNISIEELVEKTGVSKDTIYRYENASVSMNIDNLEKLLNGYGIDFNIFISKYFVILANDKIIQHTTHFLFYTNIIL